jgi:hypothetical protein
MQITPQSSNIQIHKHVHGYKYTGFSVFMENTSPLIVTRNITDILPDLELLIVWLRTRF